MPGLSHWRVWPKTTLAIIGPRLVSASMGQNIKEGVISLSRPPRPLLIV